MGQYINGSFMGPKQVTDNQGKVYDVTYTFNMEKTRDSFVSWLADNSSVRSFSWWGTYYDFDIAGRETIKEFVRDVDSHKKQVREFLKNIPTDSIMEIKKDIPETMRNNEMADEMLKKLGYEFKEKEKAEE